MVMAKYREELQNQISGHSLVVGKLLWQEGIIPTSLYDEIDQQDDDGSTSGTIIHAICDYAKKGVAFLKKVASILLYDKTTVSTANRILSEGIEIHSLLKTIIKLKLYHVHCHMATTFTKQNILLMMRAMWHK